MVKITSALSFAARLNEVLDEAQWDKRGRAPRLASVLGVSAPAARKWLLGQSIPTREHTTELARELSALTPDLAPLRAEWLYMGTVPARVQDKQDDAEALRVGRVVLKALQDIGVQLPLHKLQQAVVVRPDFTQARAPRTAPAPPPQSAYAYVFEKPGDQEPGYIPVQQAPVPELEKVLKENGYHFRLVSNPTAPGARASTADSRSTPRRSVKRTDRRAKKGRD